MEVEYNSAQRRARHRNVAGYESASAHGTGQTWIPGSHDPETNLYIFGTGNPNPVMAEQSTQRRLNLCSTCSIVALNPDTRKMA